MMNVNVTVTNSDRKRFPSHTDESIMGIKYIRKMPSNRIANALKNKSAFERLHGRMGFDVNGSWIRARLAECLYDRGVIDESEFDHLTD